MTTPNVPVPGVHRPAGRERARWSIRTHLGLLVLATVVPAALLFSSAVGSGADSERQVTGVAARALADTASSYTEQYLADTRSTLERLAARPLVRVLDPARCDPLLAELRSVSPYSANIITRDREGRDVCSGASPIPGAVARTLAQQPLTQRVLREGRFAVGTPLVGGQGRWVGPAAAPLRDDAGQVIGTVSMPIDLAGLQRALQGLDLPAGARLTLFDASGVVIAHSGDAVDRVGRDVSGVEMIEMALAESEGQGEGTGIDGMQLLGGFAGVEGTDWHVLAGFPREPVDASARRTLLYGIVTGLGALIGLVGLGLVLSHQIERPVRNLAGVAASIRAGRLDTRAEPGGPREIAAVAVEFNTMLEIRAASEHRFRFLAEAGRVLSSSLDYKATLAHVVRLAVPFMADRCGIDMPTPDGSLHRVAVAAADPAKEPLLYEVHRRYPPDPDGLHPVSVTLRTGRSQFQPEGVEVDYRAIARDAEHLRLLQALGTTSRMTVPLVARGTILGALWLSASESGRQYTSDDLALAEELARICALAIDNARLYRDTEAALGREQQARAEAEAAGRVKDQFLSTAAHELKTPVTAMKAYVQLLQRPGRNRGPEVMVEALAALDRQSDRLCRLVEDLLDVSRLSLGRIELRRQDIDLTRLAATAVEQSRHASGRHHLMLVTEHAPMVGVDSERIAQVFVNLLSNAVKFSPDGGEILTRVDVEGGWAVVSVQDHGVGIPPDARPRVFEQFYRAHADTRHDYGGMGIGLHLSREIVEHHGGTMWFESEEGKGSIFSFRVPVAEQGEAE